MSDVMQPEYEHVLDAQSLQEMVETCRQASVIAIDTEFARTSTYYPIVGLIQIYDGQHCYVVDPLELDSLQPLLALLTDADVLKVFHAGSEDMEVFQHTLGEVPSPVFDTQIAGAALGVGFSVGYQSLVEHYLSITLPKDQTRSDWLARPLTRSQLDYAALDVIHLLEVYQIQEQELTAAGKLDWVEDECLQLGVDIPTLVDPDESYLKLKGLWQLDSRQLAVLKVLCAWREVTAREEDVPRNRVIDHKALLSLAKYRVGSKEDLQAIAEMLPRQVRKYGDKVMELCRDARSLQEDDLPPLVERSDAPVNNRKLKLLRQVVDAQAKKLSVAPELLTKRRHLEKLIRSEDAYGNYHLPGELDGWRKAAIGDALLSALAE